MQWSSFCMPYTADSIRSWTIAGVYFCSIGFRIDRDWIGFIHFHSHVCERTRGCDLWLVEWRCRRVEYRTPYCRNCLCTIRFCCRWRYRVRIHFHSHPRQWIWQYDLWVVEWRCHRVEYIFISRDNTSSIRNHFYGIGIHRGRRHGLFIGFHPYDRKWDRWCRFELVERFNTHIFYNRLNKWLRPILSNHRVQWLEMYTIQLWWLPARMDPFCCSRNRIMQPCRHAS